MKAGRLAWLSAFSSGFTVLPVAAAIADRAADYAFTHRDPCDRHILATADVLVLPLVIVNDTLTKCPPMGAAISMMVGLSFSNFYRTRSHSSCTVIM